jgi:hypothetical protein
MKKWFDKKSPIIQLLMAFILNCILYLVIYEVLQKMVWDENKSKSWKEMLFYIPYMGFFLTLVSQWKLIKQVFSRKRFSD